MPIAIRIIDHVAEMADWNQASFADGMLAQYDLTSGKYIGAFDNVISGINTSALSTAGLFGYISGNNVISLTDAASINSSILFGASTIISGQVAYAGVISNASMTTIGGQPAPGAKVYLANSGDEAGAAGKLTATCPQTGVLAIIGICIDNSNWTTLKQIKMLLRIQEPILLS